MNINAILKSDFKIALVIALVWQLVMTVIGVLLAPNADDFLYHTMRWDAGWYMTVVTGHYATSAASAAFYPLFPLFVDVIADLTFQTIPYTTIGLFINTISLWLGIAALLAIAREFVPKNYRFLPVIFFLAAPAAFFMHLFYSEALFIAIGFWAYAFALRRQWLGVGVLLAFLTATRLPSILFVMLCLLEYLRAYDWKIKKAFNPNLVFFLLTPIGFIMYGLYLLVVRGDFFAMFAAYHATNDWSYQIFNPNFIYTIGREAYGVIAAPFGHHIFAEGILVNHAIPLFCILLLIASSLYMLFRHKGTGVPLGIFGLLSVVLFTLNSNIVSAHRYTLPCLVIYLALAVIYCRYQEWRISIITLTVFMLVIQASLLWRLYIGQNFVG